MADGIPVKVVDSEVIDECLYVTVEVPEELREDVRSGALDGLSLPGDAVGAPAAGRNEIERHRRIPPPARVGLGDVVARVFGAEIAEDRDGKQFVYRPNRAERRARARAARRRG